MLISADPDANTDLVRALADPLRRRIVELLADEALCVCHLVESTGAKQTNLSNHLRVLRAVGLVETERHGRFVYYTLRAGALADLTTELEALAGRARTTAATGRRRACP